MKKYLLGSLAVTLAIVLSAFNAPKTKQVKGPLTTYYWFQVATSQGDDNTLENSQLSGYIDASATTPTSGYSCSGTGHNCVVGFDASQVVDPNAFPVVLKTGAQTIQMIGVTRNTQ